MDDGRPAFLPGLPSAPPPAESRESLGLETLQQLIRRRWRTILGAWAAVMLLALIVAVSRPQEYEATTLLMVEPPQAMLTPSGQEQQTTQTRIEDDAVETQVELLRSRSLAARVVDNAGLVNNEVWNPEVRNRSRAFTPAQAAREREAVIERVRNALEIERSGSTYVIGITATAPTAESAAELANETAAAFLQTREEARRASLDRSIDWLTRRTEELQAELERKEAAVEAYRAEAGLLNAANGSALSQQQVTDVQAAVLAARADLAEREARLAEVIRLRDSSGAIDTLPSALASETIAQLRAREADVVRQEAELAQRYSDQHPSLQRIRQERESVRQAIRDEIGRIAQAAIGEVNVARSRLAALQSGMSEARSQASGDNRALVRLNQLEREAEGARSVYEGFLQRRHTLAAQSELLGPAAEIVSEASPPSAPVGRNIALILIFALAAGAIAGLLAAFAREHFDPRVVSADDVERLGVRVLSSTPALSRRELRSLPAFDAHPAGYLVARPRSGFAESYRVLRSAVGRALNRVDSRTLAVTSALPGDGKTTTAFCLARAFAAWGCKTLLIDCDSRKRSLNFFLGLEPERGLLQVLDGEIGWRDVVGLDDSSGLHVLPAAPASTEQADGFAAHRLRPLLDELRAVYEVIILDCPPVLSVAETREIVQEVDHTLIVARSGKTPRPAFISALRQVEAAGGVVLGAVLNGVDRSAPGRSSYADPLYFAPSARSFYTA